ncbi:putative NBD/HSP70 family sugar kinase [Devosia sp. UYZn731]|uniref:ROK family transcriptional regulator n=1 Tax=Devosia sp. UYZn731 TaxID=3156345 RepID=UPI003396DB11
MRQPKTKLGANSGGAGTHNRRVLMQALRLNGHLTRAEIARGTGLVPQTVSNIIEELERDGLVIAAEPLKGKRGQPATPYSIFPGGAYALGMQIDQNGTRTVAVDLLGDVVAGYELAFSSGTMEENLPAVRTAIDKVMAPVRARAGSATPRIIGMGVAMPAATGVHAVQGDPWMDGPRNMHPMIEALEAMTGLPVSLHHDASAATVAERLNGCAVGMENFIRVFVGYGLGAGLYVKGELMVGSNNLVGEVGQIAIYGSDGLEPIEQRASLAPLYAELGLRPEESVMFDKIDKALDLHSTVVQEWLDAAAPRLAWLVAMLVRVIDPECVVLGGQMPQRLMKALFDRVNRTVTENAAAPGIATTKLLMGSSDVFSVAAGAAAYPIARAFDPSLSAILKYAYDDPAKRYLGE